jgi:hypothetical protein
MANDIQIDYTSRDFSALKEDLISLIQSRTSSSWDPSDPSDLGSILVESFAYMGDIMSYYLDRVANETSVETAIKRETLLNFAALYGYKPSGPTPAVVDVTFTNISDVSIDLPIGTQVMAPLLYGPYTEIYFETTTAVIALAAGATITVTCKEGKTVNTDRPDLINPANNRPLPASLGTSDGSANQKITIIDTGIVDSSLFIYVGQGSAFAPWSYVETLAEHSSTSLVFTTAQNSDGTLTVVFGDSINGAIPPTGQLISALYKVSTGLSGNITAGAVSEVTFIPGNIDPEAISYVTATNAVEALGGANSDGSDQLKAKIKAAISSRRRAVTLADYEYLASQVPRLGRAKATGGVYSSITLYVQTQDDGSITPGLTGDPVTTTSNWNTLSADLSAYLADKIPVGTTVTVQPPTYVPIYVSMTVNIGAAYRKNTVKLNIAKAFLNTGGLFSFENNGFGRTISQSALISKAYGIEGVESVTLTKLNTDNTSSVGTLALTDGQLPYLLPEALLITVNGGLS